MKPTAPRSTRPARFFLSLTFGCAGAVALAGVACSDGAGPAPPVSPASAPDAGASPPTAPLYALASRVTLPSGGVTLIAVTDTLAAGPIDTARTLEIGGFGSAHGNPAVPGALFVGSAESPTFTKYTVSATGALAKSDSFSLMQHGLKSAPRSVVFASPTRAYAIAVEAYQIFVFDPSTMTVTEAIQLPMLKRDGFAPMWVFQAALRDGKLHVPVSWTRVGGDPGAAPDSALLVVDTATSEVVVHEEKRCGGLRALFKTGDLFFASSAGAPATWRRLYGERGGAEPCLVRLRAGETSPDASYLGRPTDLAGGRLAVDFSPAGPAHLVFQALDEAIFPIKPDSTPEQLWAAAAWRFYSVPVAALDDGAMPVATPVDLPPSALNALRFEVEGRHFVPQIEADYSQTTVVDISDPAAPVRGPTIKGSVGNFFRVR